MIQAAPPPAIVTTCRIPGDPSRGEYTLVRRATLACEGTSKSPQWLLEVRLNSGAAEQTPPPAAPPARTAGLPRGDEWMVGAGLAWSVDLLQSRGGRRYVPVTFSWGRDVMRDAGPGLLRGRLLWAVEVMPLYSQYAPTSTMGVGVSPLVWRWRFVPSARVAPFAELAFGGLFTTDAVPEDTENHNFIAHGGFGLRWWPSSRIGLTTAYRFQHISNGNQQATNPGVNAHVLWLGLSLPARGPG